MSDVLCEFYLCKSDEKFKDSAWSTCGEEKASEGQGGEATQSHQCRYSQVVQESIRRYREVDA